MSEVVAANQEGAGAGAVVSCGWDEKSIPEAQYIDVLPARFDLGNREHEAR
ncbi:hypothetical protein [Cellulomonas denverensis]|uniref:hypothetical protein n=1 Tax=Cellulomonas denverensis TaxID=264297 RepID=UPI0035ED900C